MIKRVKNALHVCRTTATVLAAQMHAMLWRRVMAKLYEHPSGPSVGRKARVRKRLRRFQWEDLYHRAEPKRYGDIAPGTWCTWEGDRDAWKDGRSAIALRTERGHVDLWGRELAADPDHAWLELWPPTVIAAIAHLRQSHLRTQASEDEIAARLDGAG